LPDLVSMFSRVVIFFIEYLKIKLNIFVYKQNLSFILRINTKKKKYENPLIKKDFKAVESSDFFILRKWASNFCLILTTVLIIICLNMVNVNNHMIVINMYIVFK